MVDYIIRSVDPFQKEHQSNIQFQEKSGGQFIQIININILITMIINTKVIFPVVKINFKQLYR